MHGPLRARSVEYSMPGRLDLQPLTTEKAHAVLSRGRHSGPSSFTPLAFLDSLHLRLQHDLPFYYNLSAKTALTRLRNSF